jgi:integrase
VRTAPGEKLFTFRFAPWEIKNDRWVTVEVVGDDAEILREWIETWRSRMIELQKLDKDNVYLFPGAAQPKLEEGDPVVLPRGSYSPSAFLELWRDSSNVLGVHETPHRIRHVVALLILALRPGDYAFVSTVLGNTPAVAEKHYGRDDGQAAAREARAAMLAAHPDLFNQLTRRLSHER